MGGVSKKVAGRGENDGILFQFKHIFTKFRVIEEEKNANTSTLLHNALRHHFLLLI